MEFPSLASFKQRVKDFTIHIGREIRWVKNDKVRARAKCKVVGCKWEIFGSKSYGTHSFQIKTFNSEHRCGRVFKNKQASRSWVIGKLVKKLRKQPNIRHGEVVDYMKNKYGVELDDSKVYRSMKTAKKVIEGCEMEQYKMLYDHLNEFRRCNLDSTIVMETKNTSKGEQFKSLYICLTGCREGFKDGCRPLIGLDGAFLKGYYGGQLISVVDQDANNHIWPIAYGIVETESRETWGWLLKLLHKDLGDYIKYGWNFYFRHAKGQCQWFNLF
jgi:hypothetical protein